MILGVDEVGRGPWAGPLVVGAVVLGGAKIDGLTDSKKLSKKKRELLYDEIYTKAAGVALGWVPAHELDEIGMSAALMLATRRAVEQIETSYHEIIIDGTINFLAGTTKADYVTTLAKADLLIPSVSAASIVAKVSRDRYMAEQDSIYPNYGFARNAGYGVAVHRAAIDRFGVTPLHRLSFAPLAKYAVVKIDQTDKMQPAKITTRQVGNDSEAVAAQELINRGHEILERNWRTKFCEIDIVSKLNDTIHFTEVKHRSSAGWGDGLAAITKRKHNQMAFAAKLYAAKPIAKSKNLQLSVVTTVGSPPLFEQYLDIIEP